MDTWLVIGKATTLNGPGIAALALGILAVLLLPRRLVAVAFVVIACFMTIGQQLVLGPLSLSIVRLMIAATLVRAALRTETGLGSPTKLDKSLVVWAFLGTVIYALRVKTTSALVGQLGQSYDAMGLFFVFRFSIREFDDLHVAIRALAVAMTVLMLLMSVEKITGLNPFAIFGGVPERTIVREGYLRAQGPFRHPILAGTLAATSIPLFASLWYGERNRDRLLSVIGTLSSFVIAALTASSSPLIASAVALLSILLWPVRQKTKALWYFFVVGLIALAAVMKAPVWYIMDRVSNLLGGTGWHRARLIDQSIKHFGEWWVAGTSYTAHWMPYQLAINPDMVDITNQFILEGVSGGILTLCAFVVMIAIAFRTLATASRTVAICPFEARIVWGMWGSLLAHVVTFFSLSYFDQMNVFWYMLLASISLVLAKTTSGVHRPAHRAAIGSTVQT
jgi:hypothetical protein